jgi:phosphohistidine phosphatase SixA
MNYLSKRLLFAIALFCGFASMAAAQSIFIVRHAEKAEISSGSAPQNSDPGLSDAGRVRASGWPAVLKDANIKSVYATEFQRTQETAAPLAKTLGLQVNIVPSKETTALIKKLTSGPGNAFVVAHSNTIPDIIKTLGVTEAIAVGDADYDNLFIVVLGEKPRVIRLHLR